MRRLVILIKIWWLTRSVDYQTFSAMIRRDLRPWAVIETLERYLTLVDHAVALAQALDLNGILLDSNVHMNDGVRVFLERGGDMIGQPWVEKLEQPWPWFESPEEPAEVAQEASTPREHRRRARQRVHGWPDGVTLGSISISDSISTSGSLSVP